MAAQASGARTRIISPADPVLMGLLVVSLLAPNYLFQGGPYIRKIFVWAAATVLVLAYARWKKTDLGRRAKFYALTRLGREHLGNEAENWKRISSAISRVVRLKEV